MYQEKSPSYYNQLRNSANLSSSQGFTSTANVLQPRHLGTNSVVGNSYPLGASYKKDYDPREFSPLRGAKTVALQRNYNGGSYEMGGAGVYSPSQTTHHQQYGLSSYSRQASEQPMHQRSVSPNSPLKSDQEEFKLEMVENGPHLRSSYNNYIDVPRYQH